MNKRFDVMLEWRVESDRERERVSQFTAHDSFHVNFYSASLMLIVVASLTSQNVSKCAIIETMSATYRDGIVHTWYIKCMKPQAKQTSKKKQGKKLTDARESESATIKKAQPCINDSKCPKCMKIEIEMYSFDPFQSIMCEIYTYY